MTEVYKPLQSLQSNLGNYFELFQWASAVLSIGESEAWLYQNNLQLAPSRKLADFVEADFGGYSRKVLGSAVGPFLDAQNRTYVVLDLITWQADGTSGNSIYGVAWVGVNGFGIPSTATNPGAAGSYDPIFTITNPGTHYEVAPAVTLTGATGSGARAHAEITGGSVTGIILDDPGSGYTTYTVVIEKPKTLVQQTILSETGISMALATDALPTYLQLSLPSAVIIGG